MPFERRFISQSLCKYDRSLSQDLFATDHRHIFCSSWSLGISEKSRKEICTLNRNPCFEKSFPELSKRDIERAQYCQQHRKSVDMKTFGQSEHDTRIRYHGMAASTGLSPSPGHRSARFARRFS